MKKQINLYVDDLRDCSEGFVVARNVDEAFS
ncbi:cyclic-phosphate processing receiver domain-containing protein [Chengkuizengella sp. SCS-71B]